MQSWLKQWSFWWSLQTGKHGHGTCVTNEIRGNLRIVIQTYDNGFKKLDRFTSIKNSF